MAGWHAQLLGREIQKAKPTPEENELLPFYDETGKVFTIPSAADVEYITDLPLPVAYDRAASKPATMELNFPWAISRKPNGEKLQPWVAYAILQQFLAGAWGYTICRITGYNLTQDNRTAQHKCDFSRDCATIESPKTSQEQRLAKKLDTVALFQKPAIVRKLYKTQVDFPDGKVRQTWWKEEFCTNCIAACTPWACSHSVTAGLQRQEGKMVRSLIVERGDRSEMDDKEREILELQMINEEMSSQSKENYKPGSDIVRPRPHFAVNDSLEMRLDSDAVTHAVDEPAEFVAYWHLVPVVASVPGEKRRRAVETGADDGKASFTTLALYERVDTASGMLWLMEYKCTVSVVGGVKKTIRWYGESDIAAEKQASWDDIARQSVRMACKTASTLVNSRTDTFCSTPFNCAEMKRAYEHIVWEEKTKTRAAVGGPTVGMLSRLEQPPAITVLPLPTRPHFAEQQERVRELRTSAPNFGSKVDEPEGFMASWHLMPLVSTWPIQDTPVGWEPLIRQIGLYARVDVATDALWIMEYKCVLSNDVIEKSVSWYGEGEIAAQKRDSWDKIISFSTKTSPKTRAVSVVTARSGADELAPLDCGAIKEAYKAIEWARDTQITSAVGGPSLGLLHRVDRPGFAVDRKIEIGPEHYKSVEHGVGVDEVVNPDLQAWHMAQLMSGLPSPGEIALADAGKQSVTATAVYARVHKKMKKVWFMEYEYHGGKDEGQRKTVTWFSAVDAGPRYSTHWKPIIESASKRSINRTLCHFINGTLDCDKVKENVERLTFTQAKPYPGALFIQHTRNIRPGAYLVE